VAGTSHASKLIAMAHDLPTEDGRKADALIVHELCALQMFRARLDRGKHTERRRRRKVAERAVAMSGVCLRALGRDRRGIEYWTFPSSPYLYLCLGSSSEPCAEDREELLRMIGRTDDSDKQAVRLDDRRGKCYQWRCLSEKADIQQLIGLLGYNAQEDELRLQLASIFLTEVKTAETAEGKGPNEEDINSEGEPAAELEGSVVESADSAVTAKTNNTATAVAIEPSRQSSRKPKPPVEFLPPAEMEKLPVELRLLPDKGSDIPEKFIIQEESVFNECEDDSDEDGDSSGQPSSHRQQTYFHFGKRYYALALMNSAGKRIRPAKGAYTVVYQIHLAGRDEPLSYTPLGDAWSDGVYYFATIAFKRSGTYTVSFLVEAGNAVPTGAVSVSPLVFTVTVEAKSISCGPAHAISSLRAHAFTQAPNRAFVFNKVEMAAISSGSQEISMVKLCLMYVYAALPLGSISLANESTASSAGNIYEASSLWDSILDVTWRGTVLAATTAQQLMECVLLLEHHINAPWLANLKLQTALPAAHFALRCCTLSSVALRIFCLDRCLNYEKAEVPARDRRRPTAPRNTPAPVEYTQRGSTGSGGRQRQTVSSASSSLKKRRIIDDEDDEDEGEEDEDEGSSSGSEALGHRNKRSRPERRKPSRLEKKKGSDSEERGEDSAEDDDDEDGDDSDAESSDSDDDEDEAPPSRHKKDRGSSSRSVGRRSSSSRYEDDDDEDEERAPRHSRRSRPAVRYFEGEGSGDEMNEEDIGSPSSSELRRKARVQRAHQARASNGLAAGSARTSVIEDEDEEFNEDDEVGNGGAGGFDVDLAAELTEESAQLTQDAEDESSDLKIRCYAILLHFRNDPNSSIFWTPVDCRVVKDYK
jgi:hypothetical protein